MTDLGSTNSLQRQVSSFARRLVEWFSRHARDLPWRRTLHPYGIWVSEIMLQQTQVKTVVPYWERWMKALPSIEALARAKPEKVLKLWEGLGYYTRARNLHRAAKIISEDYEGTFPVQFKEVLTLPGVGRYTAGAICSIAFNQPTPVLDGNTIRVLCRAFAIDRNPREQGTRRELWDLAQALVLQAAEVKAPQGGLPHIQNSGNCARLNQGLMELGALICTPRKPDCGKCPVQQFCVACRFGRVEEIPKHAPRIPAASRRVAAFVVQERGRFLVWQRPSGVVNAHLWEFPNAELSAKDGDLQAAVRGLFNVTPNKVKALCTIRHSITRYRITLEVYSAALKNAPKLAGRHNRWASPSELKRLPFSSAHCKIISIITGS